MARSPRRSDAPRAEAAAEFPHESDVRERLLPPPSSPYARIYDKGNSGDAVAARTDEQDAAEVEVDDGFTHEELLHSIGSFSAVIWPVAVTMLLAR